MFYMLRGNQAAIPAEWKRDAHWGSHSAGRGQSEAVAGGLRLMACAGCSQWSLQTQPTSQLERNAVQRA